MVLSEIFQKNVHCQILKEKTLKSNQNSFKNLKIACSNW